MSGPLVEYLSALEVRDAREQRHAQYINAYTTLADRTAADSNQPHVTAEPPASASHLSAKSVRSTTPKGKADAGAQQDASSAKGSTRAAAGDIGQIRAELASTQKIRGDLETRVSAQESELNDLKAVDAEQKKRIAQLEKIKEHLERRGKDRADELKGKGRFVEEVQDEMVALNLQLNMAEKEKERLKAENEELTRRWMAKMEVEAGAMNDNMEREIADKARRAR